MKVDREHLKKQQMAGNLVRKDMLIMGLAEAGVNIRFTVQKLSNQSDNLAVAATQGGVHGLRIALRKLAVEINTDISAILERVLANAQMTDPLIDPDTE